MTSVLRPVAHTATKELVQVVCKATNDQVTVPHVRHCSPACDTLLVVTMRQRCSRAFEPGYSPKKIEKPRLIGRSVPVHSRPRSTVASVPLHHRPLVHASW